MMTLGILGGGQLARMLCLDARRMGLRTVVWSGTPTAEPTEGVADLVLKRNFDDVEALEEFCSQVDVATVEFENIPLETLRAVEQAVGLYPSAESIGVSQHRSREKTFFRERGIPCAPFMLVNSLAELKAAHEEIGPNTVLKTAAFGYDGKGQHVINNMKDVKDDWCFSSDYILEKFIDLKQEISVIITRYSNGSLSIFEPIENIHKEQILNTSVIPATISLEIRDEAKTVAKKISEKLKYIGTMCVEFFIDKENKLYVNEIAPRVHNSGHLTINAFNVSQFENHVRAVCDLEKIELQKKSNAKMVNIIGGEIKEYRGKTLKKNQFLFDYLKKEIKDKRKMGHITTLLDT